MARNVYGLDLGTYEIKIYDKKHNEMYKVKDAIAIKDKKTILATGDEAYEMYEKAPANIEIAFPMKEGVISRFNDMQYLLNTLLKSGTKLSRGADYVIAVPTDVTEVEKKAFYDLLIHSSAKAHAVSVIERGIADAIGVGLDVQNEKAIFIANLGAETVELSVISYGGIVLNKLVKRGANHLDLAIQNLLRHKFDFLIGNITAEALRKNLGFFSSAEAESMKVSGRNLITGVPEQREISVSVVRSAMKEPINDLVKLIRSMIERIPPDILRTVREEGIYLVGGLSNLHGLDYYLSESLDLPVTIVDEPEFNSISGISKIVTTKEMKKLAYSMLEGNYRWMR